ncbi:MAG TPA: glycosyltransferase family 1 protein [Ilumatobacteraceae bacterium]|nr:glycosyltransferase family 1 protein [Ilumatobacteraceae bacterium]
MLDVAVNLLWCTPGEVGGSEQYLVRQLAGLGELDTDVAPTLCCTTAFARAHPDLAARFPVRSPSSLVGRRPARIVAEHTWLARRTAGFDIVHHGGGTSPLIGPRPILLTVHDLQYLELPQYFSPLRLRYLRFMMPRSVARASVVATPSEFVRGTVIDAFGIDEARVVVVPHGVAVEDRVRCSNPAEAAAVRQRYGLGEGPYVVYPAITHPHKNHQLLLDVMARHWTDPALRLVLIGGAGAVDSDVGRAIVDLGLRDRVVRPGRVPAVDRDALIAGATAVVFPSRYEGFGAPLIEAMALGTPVVCGDHPALREVAGSAAIVLPDDVDAWSGALEEVERRRAELVAAGRERVSHYTLAISGGALADAYHRTLS